MDAVLISLFLAVGLAALLLAATLRREPGGWWIAAIAVVAASVAGRVAGHGTLGLSLAALGEVAALGLLVTTADPKGRIAARLWALALVPAIVAVGLGFALTGLGHHHPAAPWDRVAVGLFVLGFGLKLALVPLYFWLPLVARTASATSMMLIVGVIDTGVVADLATLADVAPWVFADHSMLWTVAAILSLLGGALLAVAETDLKAIVAFTGIADSGFLLLALLSPDATAHTGVAVGLVGHALAVAALFGALAAAEAALGRPVSIADTRGLAGRLPVASGVFMVGAAALVGLPPSLGFSAHWRLFLAAADVGGAPMLAVVTLAASLVLLVMVRAVHRIWLGPSETPDAGRSPVLARAVLVAVAVTIVVTGLLPRLAEPAAVTAVAGPAVALVEGTAP